MVSTQAIKGRTPDHATGLQRDSKAEKDSESLSVDEKKGASKKPSPSAKVSISEQGRKLGKIDGAEASGGAGTEVDPAMMEEKKNDLVDFYAKQLKKATEKLEKDAPAKSDHDATSNESSRAKLSEDA